MTPAGPRIDRRELRWFVLLLIAGFLAAVATYYVTGVYEAKPWPHSSFLFTPGDNYDPGIVHGLGNHIFGDLYQEWRYAGDASPYLASTVPALYPMPSSYPPFAHVLLRPMWWLPYHVVVVLFLVGIPALLMGAVITQLRDVELPQRLMAAFVIVLMNYPILFMLDRGNIEGIVLLLILAAALMVRRGAWVWAALLIGAATAMKGYPLMFAALFLAARRYRETALSVGTAAVLTGLSFLTFSGGPVANAHAFLRALRGFNGTGNNISGIQFDSTLHAQAAVLARWPWLSFAPSVASVLAIVLLVAGLGAVLSGRLLLWQSCGILAALSVLVWKVAADYRLIFLMIPVVLMLRDSGGRFRALAVVAIAGVFIPKGLPVIYTVANVGAVNVGVLLNPLFLTVLVVVLVAASLVQAPSKQPLVESVPVA